MLSVEPLIGGFRGLLETYYFRPRRYALSQSLLGKAQGIINGQPLLRLEEAPKYANDVGDMLSNQGGVFITKPILETFVTEIFCEYRGLPSKDVYTERLENSFWALGNTQVSDKAEGKNYIRGSFKVAAFRENIRRLVQMENENKFPRNIDEYSNMESGDIKWLADMGLITFYNINGNFSLTDKTLKSYLRILNDMKPYIVIEENDYNIASASWIDLLSYKIYKEKEVARCVESFNYQELTPFRKSALCFLKLQSISEWKCSRCNYGSKCALRGMLASNTARIVDERYWHEEGLTEALTVS